MVSLLFLVKIWRKNFTRPLEISGIRNYFTSAMNTAIIYNYFSKFLPMPCPLCRTGEPGMPNGFCDACREKLQLHPEHMESCPGCGGRMSGALAVCMQCLAEPERPWHRAYSLMPYRGFARNAIRDLKFHNRPELARAFGMLLAGKIRECGIGADMVIPVPLTFARYLSRGYNQSELLADMVRSFCRIPVMHPLRRISKRSQQAGRNRLDRHKELAGSFILTAPEKIKDRRILLIDDVFTTGATLHAAVSALLPGEPADVTILTLARTPGHSGF